MYLTVLNMEDYTKFRVHNPSLLYFQHIGYVAVVGILLVNLLVAVFSDTMTKVLSRTVLYLGIILLEHSGLFAIVSKRLYY